jgi:hypothetical protein
LAQTIPPFPKREMIAGIAGLSRENPSKFTTQKAATSDRGERRALPAAL